MRICIATPLYPPEGGGPATYTRFLEERLPPRGIDYITVAFKEVRHLPKGIRHVAYAWKCVKAARHCDLILVLDTVSVGLPARIAALFSGKPYVVRVPGDHAWEQARQRYGVVDTLEGFQTKRYGWRVEFLRRISRHVVQHGMHVIVPSEFMKRIVSVWLCPGQSISVIYSGVSAPHDVVLPQNRPEGFLAVTNARLVPWKGIDGLIEAANKIPDMQVVVVSDGPDRSTLEDLAQKKAPGRVHFLGIIPNDQALGWAKTANVFVLNSTYEGLSHVLVEAMFLETPIVATNAGGNPELIENGVTGLLISPGNTDQLVAALEDIKNNPDTARARAAKAREKAEMFSVDHAIDKLEALLKTVCVPQ